MQKKTTTKNLVKRADQKVFSHILLDLSQTDSVILLSDAAAPV